MNEAALITGASRGIGLELARCFARDGHDCILVARSEDRLHEIAEEFESEYGVEVRVLAEDLTDASAARDLHETLEDDGIFVHALVNNAGFGNFGRFLEHDWSAESDLLRLNMHVLTELCHRFARPMVDKGRGSILNVASTGAFMPGPYMSTYYASKAYVLSFTEGLAGELGEHGIDVSCLCPGPTRTKFTEAAGDDADDAASQIPDFAWAEARDVAEYGYESLQRGRVVAVYSWLLKALVFSLKLTPRFLVRWFIGRSQRQPIDA